MYLLSLIKQAKFHNIRTAFDFFINYLVYLKMSRKETEEAFGGRDMRKLSGVLTRFHPYISNPSKPVRWWGILGTQALVHQQTLQQQ